MLPLLASSQTLSIDSVCCVPCKALKKALRKEGETEDENAKKSAVQTEKAKLIALSKQKSELQADTTKPEEVKNAEIKGIDLKMRAANNSLTKINSGKIDVV